MEFKKRPLLINEGAAWGGHEFYGHIVIPAEMIEKSEEGDDESGRMEGIEGGKQQEIDVGVADSGGGKKEEQKKVILITSVK